MNFKEIAKRGETGRLMDSNDFLMKRVAASALKLQKQYEIKWEKGTLVNQDDDLADRVWTAGRDLQHELQPGDRVHSGRDRLRTAFYPG